MAPPPAGLPMIENGRASLMDEIRRGRQLKKAKAADRAEKKPAAKQPAKAGAASTGDMYGDLMKALMRRRDGIAKKDDHEAAANEEEWK
jgi:hypothetical protein